MRRVLVLLVVLLLTGCTNDADVAERPQGTTVPSGPARAPVPVHAQACSGDPPFKPDHLPTGFGTIRAGDIADYTRPSDADVAGGEPYDPHFHYPGPSGARIDLYHGNSWRLDAYSLVRELQVMGRTAWLSRLEGHSLIDFPTAASPGPCDYWALGGEGVTEAELLRVAASLAAA